MKKHDSFNAIMSVLSSKENTSKDIKTDKVEMDVTMLLGTFLAFPRRSLQMIPQ